MFNTAIKYKIARNLTYKRPRVETSEVEWKVQKELSEDLKEAEKELKDNDFLSLLSSSSSDNDDSEKEMDENDE
ncbi:hypothetical protein F8M41_011734 [Gigaspora margarita]|uniref:Uncharacterized protein n=1 Tax=Gigaspora margarita TaxID=4874 RepID=A0A8H3WYZ1_GIGMA|nr:hypothetical protein F8M41_011734 [Gigaspora margarita]